MTPSDREALDALLRRPELTRILAVLDGGGEETRLVGGAVRNVLLRRPVTDIDLATTALPEVTVARARRAGFKAVPTGITHGTVTVVVDGHPFEVTTLREDVETDGRHAVVRFGRDFGTDARRRDFTINALTLGRDGRVHDEVGGLDDLAARRVRFIGSAPQRIREDYLRLLRFFRFHAQYGNGHIDPAGFAAALAARHGLAFLSAERIRAEFLKLLGARRSVETTGLLAETGLLQRLAGGVGDLGRLARAARFDVGPDGSSTPDPILRLAALSVSSPEDALRLRDRLRLSNAEADRLDGFARLAAGLRSGPATVDAAQLRRLAFASGTGPLIEVLAVLAGEPRPNLAPEARALLGLYASGEALAPVFRLTGGDLVRRGVAPGPEVGRLLGEARRIWLEAGCPDDFDAEAGLPLAASVLGGTEHDPGLPAAERPSS